MENIMLLSALFAEFTNEMFERTMHLDDIEAIKRVSELIANELPRIDKLEEEL